MKALNYEKYTATKYFEMVEAYLDLYKNFNKLKLFCQLHNLDPKKVGVQDHIPNTTEISKDMKIISNFR
jgi:hypothetical protein